MIGRRRLFTAFIILLLATLSFVTLDELGLKVSFMRAILAFCLLSVIPGFLILKILRIDDLNVTKTLVYSVGLSVSFIMFVGFLINIALPYLGIFNPISILPVTLSIITAIILLAVIAYYRNKESLIFRFPSIKNHLPPLFFLILLPLLSVLGSLLITYFENGDILIGVFLLIALIPILISINKFITPNLYPLALFSVALSLLFQQTLITQYLTGYDIQIESYYQNLVISNSYWDSSIPSNVNAMLSVTMLGPIYSLFTGIPAMWVLKIVYPMIFALVPLALFEIYREQMGDKNAFLAVFFFMSMFVFFTEMTGLPRQQIAEMFLAVLILLLMDHNINRFQRIVLAIIFMISIVVSHYGLAYICSGLFAISAIYHGVLKLWRGIHNKDQTRITLHTSTLNGSLIYLYFIFLIAWYIYNASGSPFDSLINIGHSLANSVGEFFSPQAREPAVNAALGLGLASSSTIGIIYRIIQYVTQAFIIIGMIMVIFRPRRFYFKAEYVAFIIGGALIIFLCITLPYFARALNVSRFYHISLIFLSPCFVIGGITVINWLKSAIINSRDILMRLPRITGDTIGTQYLSLIIILVVSVTYFLFNTGFAYKVINSSNDIQDIPSSMALEYNIKDGPYYYLQDIAATDWVIRAMDKNLEIYSDEFGILLLNSKVYGRSSRFPGTDKKIPDRSYIYFRYWNFKQDQIALQSENPNNSIEYVSIEKFQDYFGMGNNGKVYSNGSAAIMR